MSSSLATTHLDTFMQTELSERRIKTCKLTIASLYSTEHKLIHSKPKSKEEKDRV